MPLIAALILLLIVMIGRGAGLGALTAVAYHNYAPANEQTPEGIVAPDSPAVSGSRTSLVPWDTLGYWGRYFVATVTTTRDLQAFHGVKNGLADPVRQGRTVRFVNREPDRPALDAEWSVPRIVYLQHPSDPTVFWADRRVLAAASVDGTTARVRRAAQRPLVSNRLFRAGAARCAQSAASAARCWTVWRNSSATSSATSRSRDLRGRRTEVALQHKALCV